MRQKPRKENKELVVKGHLNRVSFCILRNPAVNGERSNKNGRIYTNYKKKAEDYDALKAKSDGFEQQIAALNKEINGDGEKNLGYKKQLEEAQGKIKGYETSSLKMRIAHENGIPYELAGRLSGSDEEEIKKDAETMAKFLRKKDVPPLAGGDPQKIDDKKTAMKGMLASLKGE